MSPALRFGSLPSLLSLSTLTAILSTLSAIQPSLAFTWDFTDTPAQCSNLTLSISGSGQPPYSVLLIPVGPSPLPNNVEARRITQQNFTGSETSISFQLKFPANSQFVAVVSDASQFGSGGTSGSVTVQQSSDSSCFNATQNVSPPFAYSIVPAGAITQCNATRIWWDPAVVQGTPSFQGVIPGGQSFAIPEGDLTTVPEEGLGFNWIPNVRGGTTMILIGGDNRGPGTAGSAVFVVNQGDNSCLSDASPSSTPGSPAGGSYPTSTSGAGTGSSSGSKTNVGAIVGGVVGGILGLIALLLVLLFFYRRRRFHEKRQSRPMDILQEDDEPEMSQQLPQYYQPEPFVVPDPTATSDYQSTSSHPLTSALGRPMTPSDRRHSRTSITTSTNDPSLHLSAGNFPGGSRSGTSASGYMRKSPVPPSFRPVNIVQHEDAGPRDEVEQEAETIELPPAYTNLKPSSGVNLSRPAGGEHVATTAGDGGEGEGSGVAAAGDAAVVGDAGGDGGD